MIPKFFSENVPIIILKLYNQTALNYLYLFLAGAFLAEYRKMLIPFVTKYWYVLTATAIVLYAIGIDIPYTNYGIVKGILCVYGLIGFSYAFPKFNIKTDISYGLYIYHMTVVNVMITLGMRGKASYMILSIAVSIVFALLSTKTIGAWASKKKSTTVISNG
jgi:peptidoglycan/LPS O-acetylase OafA/YrhL